MVLKKNDQFTTKWSINRKTLRVRSLIIARIVLTHIVYVWFWCTNQICHLHAQAQTRACVEGEILEWMDVLPEVFNKPPVYVRVNIKLFL